MTVFLVNFGNFLVFPRYNIPKIGIPEIIKINKNGKKVLTTWSFLGISVSPTRGKVSWGSASSIGYRKGAASTYIWHIDCRSWNLRPRLQIPCNLHGNITCPGRDQFGLLTSRNRLSSLADRRNTRWFIHRSGTCSVHFGEENWARSRGLANGL